MAIDRTRLVQSLAFGQAPAFGFVPPGTWNYGSQSWAWKDLGDAERVAEAKRLYAPRGIRYRKPAAPAAVVQSNPAIKHTAIVWRRLWRETLWFVSKPSSLTRNTGCFCSQGTIDRAGMLLASPGVRF